MNKTTITLELDAIQADLLRSAIDNMMELLRFSDCDDDAIDMGRLAEIKKTIDLQMRNN